MPIPRLTIGDTALLVIDMQEKLLPAIVDRDRIVNNCGVLIKAAVELGVPLLVTEHYPNGLGRTVQPLTDAMVDPAARIEKTRFSAAIQLVVEFLQGWRSTNILLCGIEAHVCVLQSALDLQASGRQCFVASDAISASHPDQVAPATRRWEAAGVVTTGVMSAMYELLGDANHPARRACVELAKQIRI